MKGLCYSSSRNTVTSQTLGHSISSGQIKTSVHQKKTIKYINYELRLQHFFNEKYP